MQIPLFKIYNDENDVEAVKQVISSGRNWAIGSSIADFEKGLKDYIGTEYCSVYNSGTSALHSLMLAYNFTSGDEIIVPSFTFISTANSPLFVNAKPVFADIEQNTFGLDPNDVLEKITSATKAIMPVHYAGCPSEIIALREIAEDYMLVLIEDAAESFGATIDEKKTGTFGDSAMLSFCQNKIIATGEGGAIVTDSKDLHEKLSLIRSHGRLDDKDYFSDPMSSNYISLGYNFRMSNITASLGLSQLKKVEDLISMRLKVANYYIDGLKNISSVEVPFIPPDTRHVFQLFSIRIKRGLREQLIEHLKSKGISSKVYFPPVHLTPFYKKMQSNSIQLPNTINVAKEILSLPMYPSMTKDEQDYVINEIKEFSENNISGDDS
ncbi:MAG: DegT/DnrJ/EryC1/StrS family aminotransferase [Candidatus Hodarchaeales archaeon]|jgi:perosamine synthetase